MSIGFGIAIYFICWWMVLFTVLPLGIRTQEEDGEVAPGTEGAAPSDPKLLKKMILTTVISAIVFAGIYFTYEYKLIDLDNFPI